MSNIISKRMIILAGFLALEYSSAYGVESPAPTAGGDQILRDVDVLVGDSCIADQAVLRERVNAEGDTVKRIAGEELQRTIAWYNAEMRARERRSQFEKELETFEVDP